MLVAPRVPETWFFMLLRVLILTLVAILPGCQRKDFIATACVKRTDNARGSIDIVLSSEQRFRSPLARSIRISSGKKSCALVDAGNDGYVNLRYVAIKYKPNNSGGAIYVFPDGSSCNVDSLSDLSLGFYPLDERLLSSNEMSNYLVLKHCETQ